MYYYDYGFFHFLSSLFWILLIIWVFSWIFRRGGPRGRHNRWGMPWENKALETLKERYAKGEISKEEYEERKKVLTEQP